MQRPPTARSAAPPVPIRLAALLLWLSSCTVTLPEPRSDVDAALLHLRSRELSGAAPIESELLERAWSPPAGDAAHEVALLHTGSDALVARAHLIQAARESIDLQVFAWEPDESGLFLFQLLADAARRGVKVRLLVDLMANQGAAGVPRVCALHENLELRVYNPVGPNQSISAADLVREATFSFWRMNQRMHNKVLVVDGRIAVVGGRNVGDSYFDMDPEFDYLDRDALVIGPAAAEADRSFEQYWSWSRSVNAAYLDDVAGELLAWAAGSGPPPAVRDPLPRFDWARARAGRARTEEVLPGVPFRRVERVEFLADLPGKRRPEGESGKPPAEQPDYESSEPRQSLLIQSNYLVLTGKRIETLKRILKERPGLQVSYLTNSLAATANTMIYGVSRKQRSWLLRIGLDVYEMRPLPAAILHLSPRYAELAAEARALHPGAAGPRYAMHAKSVVIDGRLALVSSHNLDPRSDDLNTESGVVIWSEDVARELEGELRLLMSDPNSWRSALDERIPVLSNVNDIAAAISRTLPIFDVWPVRDYGDYELRPGQEPVPDDDPAFHDRYRPVGELPEVESGRKLWSTRFYSCFGGVILGLL
jgi:phosphatidylserine/phosphatidylglycerophosphate/cardiolipin synthase-like enzyme